MFRMTLAILFLYFLSGCASSHYSPEKVYEVEGQLYKRYGYDLVIVSDSLGKRTIYQVAKYNEKLSMNISPKCTYRARLKIRPIAMVSMNEGEILVEVVEIISYRTIS